MRGLNLLFILLLTSCNPFAVKDSEDFDFSTNEAKSNKGKKTIENKFLDLRSYNIRFAKRGYLANTLNEIFGSKAESLVNRNVRRETELFGGTCLYYKESCNFAKKEARGVVASSTLREGRIRYVCESLVQNDNIWNDFKTRNKRSIASELDKDSIDFYYKQFYPLESAPGDFSKELLRLNSINELSGDEKHQIALITVCMSPNWQIL